MNADAGRRGMSRALWTIVVIFVPSAMGLILYFLLRAPIQGGCPACGAAVDALTNYCARCGYSFRPAHPEGKAAIGPGDRFCSRCGAGLADAA